MLVTVNLWAQRVPCGTVPKSWAMTGGAGWVGCLAMSGRKNLFAHGTGRVGGWAAAAAARKRALVAVQIERVIPRASWPCGWVRWGPPSLAPGHVVSSAPAAPAAH